MARGRSVWQDGRRAWERLNGWHNDKPTAVPGHPDNGDAAIAALVDVHLVQSLVSRAELIAVRTARRHGKSWSEIAAVLHLDRESARTRWEDLDADFGLSRESSVEVQVTARTPRPPHGLANVVRRSQEDY